MKDGFGMVEFLIIFYEFEGLEVRLYEVYYCVVIEFNGVGNRWEVIKFVRLCLERGFLLKDEIWLFVGEMRVLIEDVEGYWSWWFWLGVGYWD